MKKQYLPFVLALGLSSGLALSAQTPVQQGAPQANEAQHERRQDPDRETAHLAKKLNLTTDQQNQIRPILADRVAQRQAIRADTSSSREDRMAKMRSLRSDTDAKIKAVLTDDQKQKYDQIQQEMHERMQQHRQNEENQAPNNNS